MTVVTSLKKIDNNIPPPFPFPKKISFSRENASNYDRNHVIQIIIHRGTRNRV